MKPKESDWKKFKNSLDKWRERYLKRKNDEIRAILKDNDLDETEKFLNIVDFQKNVSKILRNCFDGYSRSSMSAANRFESTLPKVLLKGRYEIGMRAPMNI